MTWAPPEEFEEYRIVRPLGAGAMGRVYLAHDTVLDRAVAIKFIGGSEIGAGARARFYAEARAIARVSHPNVVGIHRIGEVRRRPFLVSEYVRGAALDTIPKPIPWQRALAIGLGLARGLASAHRRDVLHRDVKPANVVLGDDGEPKLLDFGLAKLVEASSEPQPLVSPPRELAADETVSLPGRIGDSASGDAARLTAEGAIVGTPLYLAPERWRGEPASLRTDVYALGVVLYELIAGRAPHAGLDAAELALRVPADDPAPIASCASDLPSRFAELIDACVARDPARRPESGEAVRELLEAVLPRPSAPRGSPYRGLGAFEAEHRGEFFGRAEDARAILERLRTDTVVVVAGDSGAGKSSLCRAGVLPAIADHAFVGRRWRIATLVPGARPSATLDAVLASHAGDDGLVIFVDQLEELLTVADPREARDFAERLAELVVASSTRRLLASARSDFLGRLAALPGLGELLGPAVFLLGPLSARGRREAIVGPARALGYELDPAMIDELVATGHHLPLLQFTLAELWEARDEDARRISADALIRIGGVGGALARRADQVLTVLDETDRELAWRVLVRLVTAEGTRARLARDELVEAAADRGAVERVVERLVAARLLVIGGEHVEVIHEALFTAWPRFVEWRRAHDHGARMRDLHGEAARRWHQQHRPRGMLWRGEVLAEYRAWRRRWHEPATGVEAEFDRACEADARRTRRVRTSLLAIVLVTLSIGLGILYRSDRRATQERDVAEERRAEAERQRRMLYVGQGIQELSAGHAERALPFLVEALREGDVSPSVRLLIAEALRPLDRDIAIIREFPSGIAHLMWAPDGSGFAVMARDGTTLLYDPDGRRRSELRVAPLDHIKSMAFSPDGVRLATANGNVVDLWDVATGSRIAELRGHTAKVLDVQFAAGIELISTVALDGSARLWDARTGKPQRAVIAIDATIFGCATIDREGARIAIGATDGALRVFDTATGRELFRLAAAMAHDCAVAFVPGDRLVTAGSEVRLWDTRTRAPIALLAAMTPAPSISYVLRSFVISVAPDGSRLAVGGVDGLVRVWDARSGVLVHHLPGHVTAIRSLHISDDRTRLVTAGLDRTFRIWNLQSGTLETTLEAHTTSPSISSAMTLGAWFSPDATRLLTAVGSEVRIVRTSQTGIVRDIETPIQPASAVLSPDEHLLAVAGLVRGLEVWSLDRGVRVVEIAIPSGLWDVRWSTDGKELLVVGKAGVAQIHAATGGPPLKRLVGHDVAKDVYRGTYSPDGTRIVTAAADRTVRIWDATTGAQLRVLPHEDRVMVATWSPDGKVIASASWDRTLRLWDAATGNLLTTIADPALRFLDVAFSPDGRRLAASSHAGVVAIWDVATGRRTHDLIGHTGPTSTVAWSPDGAMIASSSSDSTVRIWDVETSRQLATRGHGGEALQVTWNRSATKLIVASPIPGVRIWEVGRDTHSITELTSLLHTRVQWKLVEGRLEFVELR